MHALVSAAAATAALLVASFAWAQDQPRTAAGDAKAQAHQPAAATHDSAQAHRDADHAQPASANQARLSTAQRPLVVLDARQSLGRLAAQ